MKDEKWSYTIVIETRWYEVRGGAVTSSISYFKDGDLRTIKKIKNRHDENIIYIQAQAWSWRLFFCFPMCLVLFCIYNLSQWEKRLTFYAALNNYLEWSIKYVSSISHEKEGKTICHISNFHTIFLSLSFTVN